MAKDARERIWHTDKVIGAQEPQNAREDFEQQLERTVNRLRTMSLEKLAQGTRVSDTRAVIQEMADAGRSALGLEPLTVPTLSEAALADQLAVVGRELLEATNDEVLASAARQLQHLRSTL
jgi:hypothetical protein